MKVYYSSNTSISAVSKRDENRLERLDDLQRLVFRKFDEGNSLAVLGGAGCGKSFVLQRIVHRANDMYGPEGFAACALTNNAALSIEGVTIHRLFGAPPSWEWSRTHLWELVNSNRQVRERLRRLCCLIIDEASLLKANEIDAVDFVLRKLTDGPAEASLPLGGRQIVVTGDPFQLEPPFVDDSQTHFQTFFQSRTWFLIFGGYGGVVVAVLGNNHRQGDDNDFFELLQRVRYGAVSDDDIERLNSSSSSCQNPGKVYTRLCLYHSEVSAINRDELNKISGDEVNSNAMDKFRCAVNCIESVRERLEQVARKTITLKVGCLVVLVRRVAGFCPGSQGILTGLEQSGPGGLKKATVSFFRCGNGGVVNEGDVEVNLMEFHVYGYDRSLLATRKQIPLVPGYAVTVHRSQGLTLDFVAIDFSSVRAWKPNGMVYVVLSRCRGEKGLWVKGLRKDIINVSQRAKKVMNELFSLRKYAPSRVLGSKALQRYLRDVAYGERQEKRHWGYMYGDDYLISSTGNASEIGEDGVKRRRSKLIMSP